MNKFNVLMYHEIIEKGDFNPEKDSHIKVRQNYDDILPKPLFVFRQEFEKQMKYLSDNNYNILQLRDIIDFYYNNKDLPEKSVLITFDDMFKSAMLYGYPVLKKYGFTAVGFVVLDWLFDDVQCYSGSESVCLSKGELDTMRDVFEYACHSSSMHTRKDGITALQSAEREAFINDTEKCRQFVDARDVFAYPFGVLTEDIVRWLKEMDFKLAFGTGPGGNTIDTDPFEIHRDGVFLNFDMDRFAEILVK